MNKGLNLLLYLMLIDRIVRFFLLVSVDDKFVQVKSARATTFCVWTNMQIVRW